MGSCCRAGLCAILLLSLTSRGLADRSLLIGDAVSYVDDENEALLGSGICAASSNFTGIELCGSDNRDRIVDLYALKRSACFCDRFCHDHNDCCIDRVRIDDRHARRWQCRDIRGEFRFPMYVYQECPTHWVQESIRTLCEVEASTLQEQALYFNHLQEIPVHSFGTGVIYRNIYCAVCNEDVQLTKWKTHFHCNGDSKSVPMDAYAQEIDFTGAVYSPRKNNWKVSIDGRLRTCRLIVEEFKLHVIIPQYGARLCKIVTDSCPIATDDSLLQKCQAYTSYVYKQGLVNGARISYKNFHCAQCNNVPANNLTCVDPYSPTIRTDPQGRISLSLLFDFNFDGVEDNKVGHVQPCSLGSGQIWDPLLRQCLNVTCGKRYKREGLKCVLVANNSIGIDSDCNKVILGKNLFVLLDNSSLYVNHSMKLFNASHYEIHRLNDDGQILEVLVCAEDSYFMSLSKMQTLISEITLSISVICLILHLAIYGLLPNLRNCPGKVLMSLSSSLLCGHLFLLLGPYFRRLYWLCYLSAVSTYFGYLSAFFWMSVMAFDIHRTFSRTQSRSSSRAQSFKKYSLYSWSSAVVIVVTSIVTDHVAATSAFKPRFGNPICWFNQKRGLLLFFIVPVATLLLANLLFFSKTALDIRRVSRQTKMVSSNLSEKVRYYLYVKLSVVLGLAWVFGFLAALSKTNFLWYPFIVLNGLQGALIFAVFTVKRKVLHQLAVKLRLRSRTYKMGHGKDTSGLKKAMYSSLSNLSTLQTTLTTHVAPVIGSNPEMLKAVRKLNAEMELAVS